jgi:hypothetical protein
MSTPESKRQQRSRADFSVALPTSLYGNSHDALTFQFNATQVCCSKGSEELPGIGIAVMCHSANELSLRFWKPQVATIEPLVRFLLVAADAYRLPPEPNAPRLVAKRGYSRGSMRLFDRGISEHRYVFKS